MGDMDQLIILAGGKGTRMRSEMPKVLHLVNGVPIVRRLLDALTPIFPKPVVTIGYKGEEVRRALGEELLYAVQAEPLGTGDAVRSAMDMLPDEEIERVVVVPGDHPLISRETIERLLAFQKETAARIALVTAVVPDFDGENATFLHYGRILRNEAGDVESIVEWKDASESERDIREVNTSYYAFDAKWLRAHIGALSRDNAAREYYLTDLVRIARESGERVVALAVRDTHEALGINDPDQLKRAERYCR
ncbi:MAG: NTP transferase domain-containing protein [Candidatus Moraniibacteriota bacterium]|nr:MAG: NTP transferase domain-containing protein [Candidatus Moranbacteria bacterium]